MKNKIFVLALTLLGSVLAVSSAQSLLAVFAEGEAPTYQNEYLLDSKLEIKPFTKDGVKLDAILEYPDGSLTRDVSVSLSQTGFYKITYSGVLNNKNYSKIFTFKTYSNLFSLSGETATAEYVTYTAPDSKSYKGLKVSLSDGDSIAFNNYIDVQNTSMSSNLIKLFVIPSTYNQYDMRELHFTFTDVEDSKTYLTARAAATQDAPYQYTYWLAGGNGQSKKGLQIKYKDGKPVGETIHVNNLYGTPVAHSFGGTNTSGTIGAKFLALAYEPNERAVYSGSGGALIADLDSAKFYNSFWGGFKSQYAKLEIHAADFQKTKATFLIQNIKDIDLTQERLVDTDAPTIKLDCGLEELPDGLVNHFYPVPTATVTDTYCSYVEFRKSVYFNYYSPNPTMISSYGDRFIPKQVGKYSIVYEAEDNSGNISTKVFDVEIKNSVEAISIIPTSYENACSTGELHTLRTFKVSGGSGVGYQSYYFITYKGNQIPYNDAAFRPEEAGDYIISYVVKDFVGFEASYSYNLKVSNSDKPVFYEDPMLPKYYISGSPYVMPDCEIYSFAAGSKEKYTPSITVYNGDGKNLSLNPGESFVPIVQNKGNTIKVVYSAGVTTKEFIIQGTVPFEENNGRKYLKIDRYFMGDNLSASLEDNYTEFTPNIVGNPSVDFANALVSERLAVELRGNSLMPEYSGVRFVYTDTNNSNEKLTVNVLKNSDGLASFEINGHSYSSTQNFFSETSSVNFQYFNKHIVASNIKYQIDTYDDGKPFNGFSSEKVYLSIGLIECSLNASIRLYKIGNQLITNTTTDKISPMISIVGNYGGSFEMGETYTINKAVIGDVLDPNCSSSLTVRDPNGEVVKDVDGVLLDKVSPEAEYEIKPEIYGKYSIKYIASDTFNSRPNESSFLYEINILDKEPPVIKFAGDFQKQIKVGEYIIIPNYTITDNVDTEFVITKYIITSNGMIIDLPDNSNSLKTTNVGVYTIVIMVADKSGNITLVNHQVNVVENK